MGTAFESMFLHVHVSPSPSPTPDASVSATLWAAWIAGGAAVLAALIAAVVAVRQQRQTRALEKEKLELEDRLTRERTLWEEERKTITNRTLADQEFEEQIQLQIEHANEVQKCAIEYRRKICNRLRRLKILDMSRPLDLDRLYVQLRVREDESPRFITEEEIADITVGEPEYLLRVSRERLRTDARSAVLPEEALTRYHRMVVVGDPGAGKTTMLRNLTFKAARGELAEFTFPLYIELRDYVDNDIVDLLDYTAWEIDRRYGFPEAKAFIEAELLNGRAILLLDGLDEVLGGATEDVADAAYRRVANEIDRFTTRYPDTSIVVTCRRAGWRGGLPDFQTLEVLDFDWPEIQLFISNWFAYDATKGNELHNALSHNLRMQTLAANPLLLSLIAIVYERDLELPERRAELYNRCVEVLLKDWDSHRDIRRFSRFTTDRKRDLLEEVAWHFHHAGRRYFPADELLTIISEFLPTIALNAADAEAILNEIVAQYGLLKVQAHGWFGFLHLTLQEYFAAVAANEQGETAIRDIARRRHSPWWEEVILLLAGRMADASPLLLSMLGHDSSEPAPGQPLAADDDVFHGDLISTVRCLTGTPRLRVPWLRSRLISEARQLLLQAPYQVVYKRAARVLAEIGGDASYDDMLSLVVSDKVSVDRRRAILEAFADANDNSIAPRLLSLFVQHNNQSELEISEREINVTIIGVLVKLQYMPAAPVFLDLLKECSGRTSKQTSNSSLASNLGRAIGNLKYESSKSDIWSIIQHEHHNWTKDRILVSALIYTIGKIGNIDDVEPLFMLTSNEYLISAVISTVMRLAEEVASPRLVAMLADPKLNNYDAHDIVKALAGSKSVVPVDSIFELLRNSKLSWKRRWSIGDLLSKCPRSVCEDRITDLLTEKTVDRRIKIRLATVLAEWDNAAGLPLLLNAYDETVLQPDIKFERLNSAISWSTWWEVSTALQRLGNTDVCSALLARYDQAQSQSQAQSQTNEDSGPKNTLLYALLPFKIEELIPILAKSSHYGYYLGQILTKDTLPIALDILESEDSVNEYLVQAVGALADTPEEAGRLLRLLQSGKYSRHDNTLDPRRTMIDELAEALELVSRRAGVRAFSDGRIMIIDSSQTR